MSLLLPAITAATAAGEVDLAGSITHLVTAGLGGATLVALIGSIQDKAV